MADTDPGDRHQQIDDLVAVLREAWHANPSQRLTQLVKNAVGIQVDPRFYNAGDTEAEAGLRQMLTDADPFGLQPPPAEPTESIGALLTALLTEYDATVSPALFTTERALRERVGAIIGYRDPRPPL